MSKIFMRFQSMTVSSMSPGDHCLQLSIFVPYHIYLLNICHFSTFFFLFFLFLIVFILLFVDELVGCFIWAITLQKKACSGSRHNALEQSR